MKKLSDEGDIDQGVAYKFGDEVRGFDWCAYSFCIKWLKLDCPFVKNCQFADFNKRNEIFKY